VHTRRFFLKVVATVPAAAALPGCGDNLIPPDNTPRFLTPTERRVLAAMANAIYPPDDQSPGAGDLGAVDFIESLLTAFDYDPPHIHAAGPFSGRQPFPDSDGNASTNFPPDQFDTFLPLTRVQEAGWRLRIFGSAGLPDGGPNDAVLGPVVGLQDLLRNGIAAAIEASPTPIDQLDDTLLEGLYQLVTDDVRDALDLLVLQSVFANPEYSGNSNLGGWHSIYFEGDSMPLGYTRIDGTTIVDRDPDLPVIAPQPTPDPEPMDDEIIQLYAAAVIVLQGKQFY